MDGFNIQVFASVGYCELALFPIHESVSLRGITLELIWQPHKKQKPSTCFCGQVEQRVSLSFARLPPPRILLRVKTGDDDNLAFKDTVVEAVWEAPKEGASGLAMNDGPLLGVSTHRV